MSAGPAALACLISRRHVAVRPAGTLSAPQFDAGLPGNVHFNI
jgi:hypothetical protein